jgi:hypothetical protein
MNATGGKCMDATLVKNAAPGIVSAVFRRCGI